MNGHTSGRSSAAPRPSRNASRRRPSRWRSIAHRQSATRMPSELPRKKLRMNSSARTSAAGRDQPGDRAREPLAEPEGHREGEDPAGAGDDQPQQRRAVVAGEAERRREDHRQRLPRRAGRGDQVAVGDLAAPDDPGPRVVGRDRRERQRQRRQREAAEHEQPPRARRRGGGVGGVRRRREPLEHARGAGRERGQRRERHLPQPEGRRDPGVGLHRHVDGFGRRAPDREAAVERADRQLGRVRQRRGRGAPAASCRRRRAGAWPRPSWRRPR